MIWLTYLASIWLLSFPAPYKRGGAPNTNVRCSARSSESLPPSGGMDQQNGTNSRAPTPGSLLLKQSKCRLKAELRTSFQTHVLRTLRSGVLPSGGTCHTKYTKRRFNARPVGLQQFDHSAVVGIKEHSQERARITASNSIPPLLLVVAMRPSGSNNFVWGRFCINGAGQHS